MTRFASAATLAAAALIVASGASAAAIYRCGNAYGQVPCTRPATGRPADGGTIVDGAEQPADAERLRDARRVAQQERQLADDMTRDRRLREQQTRPAAATSLGPAKAPTDAAPASLKPKRKTKAKIRVLDPDDFTARVPRKPKAAANPATATPR